MAAHQDRCKRFVLRVDLRTVSWRRLQRYILSLWDHFRTSIRVLPEGLCLAERSVPAGCLPTVAQQAYEAFRASP